MSNLRVNSINPRTAANVDFGGLDIPSYQGVPLVPSIDPDLTGTPTADTPPVNDSTRRIANTAWTQQELLDYDTALQIALASSFSGVNTSITNLNSNANPLMNGAVAQGSSTRKSSQDHVHPIDTSRAPLASPSLTGVPLAPTAAAGTSTTQLATTAFACPGFSHGASGWVVLPSGLIIQWMNFLGTSAGTILGTRSFPITFPSQVYSMVGSVGPGAGAYAHRFDITNTSSFTISADTWDSGNGAGLTIRASIIAIGI